MHCCDFYDFEPDNHAALCPTFRELRNNVRTALKEVWLEANRTPREDGWQPIPVHLEADADGDRYVTLKEEKEWIRTSLAPSQSTTSQDGSGT